MNSKNTCTTCYGEGEIKYNHPEWTDHKCYDCGGTGETIPYKCVGCDNLITSVELCDNCAGTEISMAYPLNPDNHEYLTKTIL